MSTNRRWLAVAVTLALALLTAPFAIDGQPRGRVYRIGWLGNVPAPPGDPLVKQILEGLRERGWVEGQNLVIEHRYWEGRPERLSTLAAELVQLQVDLILALSTPAAAAAKQATTTIPIVFANVGDPVDSGLIASFARPGGNLTGLGGLFAGVHMKMLELLKATVPGASRVAVVWNSTLRLHTKYLAEVQDGARQLGLALDGVDVRSPDDLDGVFAAMARKRPDGLLVLGQPLILANSARIAKLAADHRLPAIYRFRELVEAGGLMSYGSRLIDAHRRVPYYVDRILRGARPGDLPVERPTRIYLTINLKSAKALGLTIPPSVLARADEVID